MLVHKEGDYPTQCPQFHASNRHTSWTSSEWWSLSCCQQVDEDRSIESVLADTDRKPRVKHGICVVPCNDEESDDSMTDREASNADLSCSGRGTSNSTLPKASAAISFPLVIYRAPLQERLPKRPGASSSGDMHRGSQNIVIFKEASVISTEDDRIPVEQTPASSAALESSAGYLFCGSLKTAIPQVEVVTSNKGLCVPEAQSEPLSFSESSSKQEPIHRWASSDELAPSGKHVSNFDDLPNDLCSDGVGKPNDESQAEIIELKRQFEMLRHLLPPGDESFMLSKHADALALLQRGLNVLEHRPL
mmetsp:Transcript_53331/g.103126  ORF Transcript_53331/g.103126 Transcript_53331/m.103126 type:complete len:305 (-) Transcript_53331:134-1048(-)